MLAHLIDSLTCLPDHRTGRPAARIGFLAAEFFRGMNRLVFWVGLPPLLFYKIATSTLAGGQALRIFWGLLGGTALCVAVAYAASTLLGLRPGSRRAFVQACPAD